MSLLKDIDNLKTSQASDKLEIYKNVLKQISELHDKEKLDLTVGSVNSLHTEVVKDLGSDDLSLVNLLLDQLKSILKQDPALNSFFSDEQQQSILKSIINLIKVTQEEKILLLCFSCLDEILTWKKIENYDIENFLNKTADILNKRVPVSVHVAACNFVFRFIKAYEKDVSQFIHILPKLIFIPLSHGSTEVREIAERTVDSFPKVLLYFENDKASSVLLKIVKESYCKDLLQIMKDKRELYVLKVWNLIVDTLGKTFHTNLTVLTPFFQLVEKGFKSLSDEICKAAFMSWKHIIDNFALAESVLNDSKKLRFILKPFKNVSKTSDTVTLAACESWWHLVWSLNHNLSSRFTEVCLPLLEFTIGKSVSNLGDKSTIKASHPVLMKRGCEILLRLLEQPPNTTFGRISSPKKLPALTFPPLQTPLNVKEISRHFKEILSIIRTLIDVFGNQKDMTIQVDCLMKSLLFIVSSVVEEDTKESMDIVVAFINLVNEITDSALCPSATCLKCIDILSKLPKSTLTSHCFTGGIRKHQDILCVNLLKVLFHPYLIRNETTNKRFLPAYNRLIQAGICDSQNPLWMTQKFIQILKTVIASEIHPAEFLLELWSGIASSLLTIIEKTQDVNEGDKQDHDFSCLNAVLLFPFEPTFPSSIPQLHTKPSFQLWSDLYKAFIRNAELVPTTLPNETSEQFCAKLKSLVADDELKDPQTFENFCHLLNILLETMDFSAFSASNSQGIASILAKQKNPLGSIKSFINLLSIVLNSFYSNFIDVEEEVYQSCTPKAQKKGHVYKTAMPMDILKTLFQNLKSGSLIRSVLEEIIHPISKLFSAGQKKFNSNMVCSKLETLLNVMMSAIEMYYPGPYDSEFLSVISPFLEACFMHPRRQIKERCRRFWFASFGHASSTLKYPESLKNVMKKSKLPLISGENISPLDDSSFTPDLGVLEDSETSFGTCAEAKDRFVKPFEVFNPKVAKEPSIVIESSTVKKNKTASKKSLDELADDEFVKISSPSTSKRKSIRKRKSFVPAMYNDLSQSQDTSTLGGFSGSFDGSCELIEFQSEESEKPLSSSKVGKSHEEEVKNLEVCQPSNTVSEELVQTVEESDCSKQIKTISSQEKVSILSPSVNDKVDLTEVTSNNNSAKEDFPPPCSDTSKDIKKEPLLKSRPPTPHVKKTARKSASGRKRALSETFSLLSPPSTTGKPVIDIVDISDSDEIIPSSQSSSESENPGDTSSRTSGAFSRKSPFPKKNKVELAISITPLPLASEEPDIPVFVSNDIDECPETPTDLMSLPLKIAGDEIKSQSKTESESEEIMPLKSSENLLSSEEPIAKPESQDIKVVFSDILKPIEGQNVAENTPPLFDDVFVVQNAMLESETKAIPFAESGTLNTELKLQTSSDLTKDINRVTRNRSARIAARKSLEPSGKKATKKVSKRKSMFELTQTDPTSKKSKSSSANTAPIKATEAKNDSILEHPEEKVSTTVKERELKLEESCTAVPPSSDNFADDSLMMDVSNVISDIQDKLASFSEPYSCEETSQEKIMEPMEVSSCKIESLESMEDTLKFSSQNSGDNQDLNLPDKMDCSNDFKKENDVTETHEEKFTCEYVENSVDEPVNKISVDTKLNDILNIKMPEIASNFKDVDNTVKTDTGECIEPSISDKTLPDSIPESQDITDYKLPCESSEMDPVSSVKPICTISSVKTLCNNVCQVSEEALSQNLPVGPSLKISFQNDSDSSVEKATKSLENETDCLKNQTCSESRVEEIEFTCMQNSLECEELLKSECETLALDEQSKAQHTVNSSDIFESKENIDTSLKSELVCEESNKAATHLNKDEEISQEINLCSKEIELDIQSNVLSNAKDDSEFDVPFNCTQKTALVSISNYGSSGSEDTPPNLEENNASSEMVSHHDFKEFPKLEASQNENSEVKENISEGALNVEMTNQVLTVSIEKLEEVSYKEISEENTMEDSLTKASFPEKSEGASRKRKPKCPVRSPFNFRQRSTVLVSSITHKKNESDPSKRSLFSDSIKSDDTASKKIKLSLSKSKYKEVVPTQKICGDPPCNNSSSSSSMDSNGASAVKRTSDPSKMTFDELTSMNTRVNASTALQTRRLKLLTTSQQSIDVEFQTEPLEPKDSVEEKSVIELPFLAGSILKKRQSSDFPPLKVRKVTFADPLYEELLFRKEENSLQCSKSLNPPILFKEQNSNGLKEKDKASKSNAPPYLLSSEDTSPELENSDSLTDYSNLPVSPLLINCKESVRVLLNDLTSPAWVCALETLLESRHIKTIGDLCQLNIHELKALPFRSPKVLNLHRALVGYLNRTQTETLEKLKHIDDGCAAQENEREANNDVHMVEIPEREIFESLAAELMLNKIEHLSTQTLVTLSKKCVDEMSKRLQNS